MKMSILFDKAGKAYHKVYSKEDIELLAKQMKKEEGIYDVTRLNMLLSTSPADDIEHLGSFMRWDFHERISAQWFPKNWDAKQIIEFLLEKFNTENYLFSWYEEIKPEAQKYGLHDKNDYCEPYISIKQKSAGDHDV